ncbi:zinc finger CCCH domain-containing protein 5 [Helianthus annuus]|uniref:zinc finger CCCH domain-containing protein 5 n=1 Tax=Helianthus annuus TaxID=4232 RepID=UPI000B9084F3|nr:zinc finger CCCH domain-containing protein 5 [Helianthus annuus]XP_021998951.1 zinc finger CCCH domain-containing protein 5 [Helianthus annuus]
MEEQPKSFSRKEKRKALKKEKRKQIRKEVAEKARAQEEARLNDPELQRQIQMEEEREKERLERERKDFEERERIFLEKKNKEEELERIERESKLQLEGAEEGHNEDDEWEYVEEGPPEIIWQGNEIIVKKNKVRVKKKDANQETKEEDPNRPTSNPLPPQHEAYAAFKNAPMTSAELLNTVAQQVPNFGTEQDKAHCPFHIKTGACRFGLHCNRVHYYPDKSNTLLIKNMYNGPGLAWEQDEGLEYTEEEVERSYEEFYEDVHTEFLKFGEILNFKVCRNGSFHLRGNVYVHYKSLDSAVMAYSAVHGRYFAGKQVKCEFVSLTRWKVAICGEYMKSRLKTCSRGSACNFLHCFSNPGGDYEWADCDKAPPRYWVNKMTALFGYSDESPKDQQHSSTIFTSDRDSYHYKRHRSIDSSQHNGNSSRSYREETHARKSRRRERQEDDNVYEDATEYINNHNPETDSDGDRLDRKRHGDRSEIHTRKKSKSRDHHRRTPVSRGSSSSDEDLCTHAHAKRKSRHRKNIAESSKDVKTEPSEGDLLRQKTKSTRRRSRHDDRVEVDYQESKKAEGRRQHRPRSHESADKNDASDRWQPHIEHDYDYEISDGRKPKDRIIDHETPSGSVVEDASKEMQRSRERDDRTREKRKRI